MTTPPGTGAELLSCERHGSVALLTLNRPDKLNAINIAMQGALDRALTVAEADATVRAIVVNGAGRAFSAGFDLDMELGNSATPDASAVRRALENDFRLIMRFWDSPKVTLAAVHGYCLGGALELALACDLTIASEECLFGAPEVRFGPASQGNSRATMPLPKRTSGAPNRHSSLAIVRSQASASSSAPPRQ